MKALKVFLRIFFTIFFIILIFAIALVLSYTLSSPDTSIGKTSRDIVSGPWEELQSTNTKKELYKFTFSQGGDFLIEQNGKTVADGWFKIDEKSSKIKLLMLPNHYNKDFAKYVKYKVLAEVSYTDLVMKLNEDDDKNKIIEGEEPSVSLLLRTADGSAKATVFDCKMYEYTLDLYASEHDLTKDA